MRRRIVLETLDRARRAAAAATGVSIALLRRLDEVLGGPERSDTPALVEFRRLLGIEEPPPDEVNDVRQAPGMSAREQLRERFSVLLARSQSPAPPEGAHPAMEGIVAELSPDEARILRLLHTEGPQPVVSVRAVPLIGRGEETILEQATLVADRAGCHRADDGPAYLDNLRRLGLVSILSEELTGHADYDVIASRPEVAAAEEVVTEERNQRVDHERGHVRLSHLGELLCDICLS